MIQHQKYPLERPKQILIVGGGLAGSFVAAESVLAGHNVTLVDAENPNAATQIAAGLFNVITGRTANKTWQADAMLHSLQAFFQDNLLQPLDRFFHPRPLYRPYKSISERNEWFLRSAEPAYEPLVRHISRPHFPEKVHNPLGGLEILPCGWIEAGKFTTALKAQLAMAGNLKYIQAPFEYSSLDPNTLSVDLFGEEETFDEVIFSEGIGALKNPFFNWVEIIPLKGQVLEIEMEGLPEDFVLLRKAYLVPLGEGRYVVGSTYEKNFSDPGPTKEGIDSLKRSVAEATPLPFKVLDAKAGLRPTTFNRRPIMGRHPDYPGLCMFNGLGTKGVLQAPWCASLLRKWLDGGPVKLPEEIGVERFR